MTSQKPVDHPRAQARAPILTRRLLLREPAIADLPTIARLINDPLIARNTSGIRYPYAPIEGWRFLRSSLSGAGPSHGAHFLVTLAGNPRRIVGGISWMYRRTPEIGYWIAAGDRRRGFAGEATRALIARIFAGSAAQKVEAWCRVDNAASQRVLLGAGLRRVGAGMTFSKALRRYVPVIRFAITRAQWARLKRHG